MDSSNNFSILAKLVAIGIVGSVAKGLFGQPGTRNINIGKHAVDAAKDVAETVKSS